MAISRGRWRGNCSILDVAAHPLSRAERKPRPVPARAGAKAVKEVAYHRELAADWMIRLGDGTEESAARMAEGLDWCWRFIPELFEVDETAGSG